MNIEDLIYKCKIKNRTAQAYLFQSYRGILFNLCIKYCKNRKDAEDVLQDSFIEIFQNINKYNAKGSFEGWLKRITINKAIDKYHKTKNRPSLINEKITEEVYIEENLDNCSLDFLLKIIQELPNKYRLVFNLYELDNYSHKEIARLLKISVGTSKSNLHRAKLILKEKITHKKSIQNYG